MVSNNQEGGSKKTKAVSAENLADQQEQALNVQALIECWNEQEVNRHPRLGKKTKLRIHKAFNEALEDYAFEELRGSIVTYFKLYKDRRCKHKYRLVEFMEKRAYEHFLHEKNGHGDLGSVLLGMTIHIPCLSKT